MTGQVFKDKLEGFGVSFVDLAKRLKVSKQSLHSNFQAADVKSGLIEKCADALGISVADFYRTDNYSVQIKLTGIGDVDAGASVAAGDGASVSNDTETKSTIDALLAELSAQRKTNERLMALLEKSIGK